MKHIFKIVRQFVALFFGVFSETHPASMTRFLSFCMFFISTDLAYRIVSRHTGPLGQWDFYTIIGLYSLAFFPKVIQKFMEKGPPQNSMYDSFYSQPSTFTEPAAAQQTVNYQDIKQ